MRAADVKERRSAQLSLLMSVVALVVSLLTAADRFGVTVGDLGLTGRGPGAPASDDDRQSRQGSNAIESTQFTYAPDFMVPTSMTSMAHVNTSAGAYLYNAKLVLVNDADSSRRIDCRFGTSGASADLDQTVVDIGAKSTAVLPFLWAHVFPENGSVDLSCAVVLPAGLARSGVGARLSSIMKTRHDTVKNSLGGR